MIRSYQLRFNYIEMRRRSMIQHFVPFTPEQLQWSPGPNQWSLLQVAQHCLLVEELILQQVKKNRERKMQIPSAGLLAGPKLLWASILMTLPIRLRIPQNVPVEPKTPMKLAEIHERWEATRAEWKTLLESVTDDETGKAYFVHPVLGAFTLGQTVRFMAIHLDHHTLQIARIVKSDGFPEKESTELKSRQEKFSPTDSRDTSS